MEAASRFELEIKALQASALPLGEAAKYAFFCLERETGFEPATSTLARLHSTTELLPLNEEEVYRRSPFLSSVVFRNEPFFFADDDMPQQHF